MESIGVDVSNALSDALIDAQDRMVRVVAVDSDGVRHDLTEINYDREKDEIVIDLAMTDEIERI